MRPSTTLLLPLVVLLAAACGANRNRLTIENRADIAARLVTVGVCGQEYRMEDIAPGGRASTSFTVDRDSSFAIRADLADGTSITNEFGYVTGGAGAYGNRVEFEIARDRSIRGVQR